MRTKLFRSLLPLALMFTMISCSTDESTTPAGTDAAIVNTYDYKPSELKLMDLINDYRESVGLNQLEKINYISYKSEEHNYYMMENDVVNHDFFQQRSQDLINLLGAERVGENVAYNFGSPEGVLNAWLNSPGHKENIEGDYTNFGVAITTDPETGRMYYTNMFIKK
jgi:uncharacterized protein YkwD